MFHAVDRAWDMTLAKLKSSLRASLTITFLVVYALGFYLLGKNSSLVPRFSVKGTSTQQTIETPLESPIPAADTQSATITSSFVKLCANTVYGFELSYPKDWFTTYNNEQERCNFFAPYSFVVPYETANFLIPIRLEVIKPEDWPGNVKFHENPNDFYNVVSSQNVEVEDRSAKRVEAVSTGNSSIPRGFIKITYLIFDAQNPMIITYQQTGDKENIEALKDVLSQTVSSIRYF